MRLHHLEMTAFGPFAGTVAVDFDELAATGLFLLTGKTGAGKTSVLDAVCFGLYGEVPGDRAGARALRSDHAAPEVEPRVVLVVGVGDRLLRFTRTPAWDRPRRRGDGTRRIPASVVVEEQRAGVWQAVTTRLDEAGQLVTGLLGMTCQQFTQVVLLPQGRFQSFLRASSAERHAVLQRLFRTQRFDDVERWLAERRRLAGRALDMAQERVTEVLDRLCEAAGTERPAGWHDHGGRLATLLDDGSLERWLDEVERDLATTLDSCRRRATTASEESDDLTRQLTEAQALAGRRRLAQQTAATLAQLDAEAGDVARARAALAAHERARPVQPLVREAAARVAAARAAADQARHARQSLPEPLRQADLVALEAEHELLVGVGALVRGWSDRERRLVALRRRGDALALEIADLDRSTSGGAADRVAVRATLTGLESERQRLAAARPDAAAAAQEVQRVAAALEAAGRAQALREQVREAVDTQQAVTDEVLRLREEHLELWERRISGAAGELATRLAVGCSCPVCGSLEHPSPARGAEAVPEALEAEVRARAETAETERLVAAETVAALRSHLAAAETACDGATPEVWAPELDRARAREQEARDAVRRAEEVDHEVEAVRARLEQLEVGLAEATARRDERAAAHAQVQRDLAADEQALAELLRAVVGDPGTSSSPTTTSTSTSTRPAVVDVVRDLDQRCAEVAEALRAARREREASASSEQAGAAASGAVAHAGFADERECLDACLDEAQVRATAARVDAWQRARAEAEHTWSTPGVAAALDLPEPPVDELTARLDAAVAARDDALADLRAVEQRGARSAALRTELAERCRAWAPLRAEHDAVGRLAALAEGTGADNRLRMRLSGYVLAERLRQVVAAANERLSAMTQQRFALEHVEEKGAGEQRGGLSLRVRDDWSGTRRDPATLSGGESFQVSLALALGLADTVAHEAGGAVLDTLFVDEGFGALDADSLDAVMDVLDDLRDGGRVVGLVSHVAELRDRVPARLEVRLGRNGSTLGPTVLPG